MYDLSRFLKFLKWEYYFHAIFDFFLPNSSPQIRKYGFDTIKKDFPQKKNFFRILFLLSYKYGFFTIIFFFRKKISFYLTKLSSKVK